MTKIYFQVDAEYTMTDVSRASEFADGINNGTSAGIPLTLKSKNDPLLNVAFFLNNHQVVKGALRAVAKTKKIVSVVVQGVFFIDAKPEYERLLLDPKSLLTVSAEKSIKGVKTVEYKDYYGKHKVQCLEVVASKNVKTLDLTLGSGPSNKIGKAGKLVGKSAVKDVLSCIEINGPFIYIQCAPISMKDLRDIEEGKLASGELEEKIQSKRGYFSLYGAEFSRAIVKCAGVFEYSAKSTNNIAWYKDAPIRKKVPSEVYLKESIDALVLNPKAIYVITVDSCSGREERVFRGQYRPEKLSINRVRFTYDSKRVLGDVLQVNYFNAKINDFTEQEPQRIYILEGGNLRRI